MCVFCVDVTVAAAAGGASACCRCRRYCPLEATTDLFSHTHRAAFLFLLLLLSLVARAAQRGRDLPLAVEQAGQNTKTCSKENASKDEQSSTCFATGLFQPDGLSRPDALTWQFEVKGRG